MITQQDQLMALMTIMSLPVRAVQHSTGHGEAGDEPGCAVVVETDTADLIFHFDAAGDFETVETQYPQRENTP